MSNFLRLFLVSISIVFLSTSLSGCAGMRTYIKHRKPDFQNRMSGTVFLRPTVGQKTIFVEFRNTSDKEDISLSGVQGYLEGQGSQVVSGPDKALYLLQANILFVGMTDPSAAEECLANGYGGALVGMAGGALAGAAIGGSALGAGVGGLVGGLAFAVAEAAINASIKNVTYTAVVDIQISERTRTPVNESQRANINQGSSTTVFQAQDRESNFLLYRTRIVSTANQVNMTWQEAKPELEAGLVRSIAGLF